MDQAGRGQLQPVYAAVVEGPGKGRWRQQTTVAAPPCGLLVDVKRVRVGDGLGEAADGTALDAVIHGLGGAADEVRVQH